MGMALPDIEARLTKARQDGVGVGMVIAAAIIADQSDVYAEEILGAAGVGSVADMRDIGCDDYDIDQLRGLIKEMQRKRKLDKRRAAITRADGGGA